LPNPESLLAAHYGNNIIWLAFGYKSIVLFGGKAKRQTFDWDLHFLSVNLTSKNPMNKESFSVNPLPYLSQDFETKLKTVLSEYSPKVGVHF